MLTSVYYNFVNDDIFFISSKSLTELTLQFTDIKYLDYNYDDDFIVEYLSKACIFLGYL